MFGEEKKPEYEECRICQVGTICLDRHFATCDHTGFCKKCCEQVFQISIVQNKRVPKCLEQGCDAVFLDEGKNCMFEYFSQKYHSMWKNFKKTILTERVCSKPDCPGILKGGKCLTCETFYCQKCWKIEHQGVKCVNDPTRDTDSYGKKCPQCHITIEKDGGCLNVKCTYCDYSFCYECLKPWVRGHENQHGLQGQSAHVWGGIVEWFGCFSKPKPRNKKKQTS